MKQKNYVGMIVRASFIGALLFFMIIKNSDLLSKLMILPFLLCSLFSIAKNICLALQKDNLANVFRKLFVLSFLLFWFGLLGYSSYLFINEKNLISLIVTLPFWFVGIYIIRKFLFGISVHSPARQSKSRFHFPLILSTSLVTIVLIIGVTCLFVGIRNTYMVDFKTKDYILTEGYFQDYEVYRTNKGKTTYRHIYSYNVLGKEYSVKTDFGLGYIPSENSVREVKYNPNCPSESVLVGTNQNQTLIYFGAFFVLGGSVFVIAGLYIKGFFDNVKIDVMGTYVGIVFFIVGIGLIMFQSRTLSLLQVIQSFGVWIFVPVMFIVIGAFQVIKCLFFKKVNNSKKANRG